MSSLWDGSVKKNMQEHRVASEKRGSLLQEAEAVILEAQTSKRELSNAEEIRLAGIKKEIFNCDKTIARCSTLMRMEDQQLRREDMSTSGYSLVRAITQASNGRLDGLELEVSQEIAHRSGQNPNGFFVPNFILAEKRGMSVTGNGGVNGGLGVATEVREFLEALRPFSKVITAGATLFNGLTSNISIPKQSAASLASWKSETELLGENTPVIEQVVLSPKRVGSFIELSNQLLVQTANSIEDFIRRDLLGAVGQAIDLAAIAGTGADNQPKGILATVGIGDVAGGTNGLAPTWANIVALAGKLADANADFGKLAFLTNSKSSANSAQLPRLAAPIQRCCWSWRRS